MLEIGRIGRAHGIRGAVYVTLSTDRTERVAAGTRQFDGTSWLTIEWSRSQPGKKWVVQFEGSADRNAAEAMTGRLLSAEPIDDVDALWVHELIGGRVIDATGTERGICVSVVANPAHDLLELDTGHLVPITFVGLVEGGIINVDTPDGLFELLD